MSKYREIIERLEKAEGQDRILGRDVFFALDGDEWRAAYARAQEPSGCPHHIAVIGAGAFLPDVTGSIDAALALVERLLPFHSIQIDHECRKRARIYADDGFSMCSKPSSWLAYADAPTTPLAILLALFRALGAQATT